MTFQIRRPETGATPNKQENNMKNQIKILVAAIAAVAFLGLPVSAQMDNASGSVGDRNPNTVQKNVQVYPGASTYFITYAGTSTLTNAVTGKGVIVAVHMGSFSSGGGAIPAPWSVGVWDGTSSNAIVATGAKKLFDIAAQTNGLITPNGAMRDVYFPNGIKFNTGVQLQVGPAASNVTFTLEYLK